MLWSILVVFSAGERCVAYFQGNSNSTGGWPGVEEVVFVIDEKNTA
jgi:hypothetical protein